MACAHPVTIVHGSNKFRVPCRQCMPCRVTYQQSIIFAATNELQYMYRSGYGASFCCFTYNDDSLPGSQFTRPDITDSISFGSLYKKDLQLFMKRVRSSMKYNGINHPFKYIACGEYGDKFGRAHYHVVFIGLSDVETKLLSKNAWPYGIIDIQALGRGGMRYVTKYCTKQLKGDKAIELYDSQGLQRPFLCRSVKMGYQWLNDNYDLITTDNFQFIKDGRKVTIPKYYRNIIDKTKSYDRLSNITAMAKVAETMGMSLYDYQKYVSTNMEKMLIASSRADGLPVDDSQFIIDSVPIYSSSLGRMAEDIIDPVPF